MKIPRIDATLSKGLHQLLSSNEANDGTLYPIGRATSTYLDFTKNLEKPIDPMIMNGIATASQLTKDYLDNSKTFSIPNDIKKLPFKPSRNIVKNIFHVDSMSALVKAGSDNAGLRVMAPFIMFFSPFINISLSIDNVRSCNDYIKSLKAIDLDEDIGQLNLPKDLEQEVKGNYETARKEAIALTRMYKKAEIANIAVSLAFSISVLLLIGCVGALIVSGIGGAAAVFSGAIIGCIVAGSGIGAGIAASISRKVYSFVRAKKYHHLMADTMYKMALGRDVIHKNSPSNGADNRSPPPPPPSNTAL